MLTLHGDEGKCKGLTLSTIARAVWLSDVKLTRILIARSKPALAHVSVNAHTGRVELTTPVAFASTVSEDRRCSISERIRAEQSDLENSA
eukprot:4137061-Heterocapsa_arctica.AAC.1